MAHEFAQLALVPIAAALPPIGVAGGTATRVATRKTNAVGPGWFDSSWDLRRGLEVQEGWPGDHALRSWLDDFLAAQRSAGRIASPSASTAMA